MNQSHLANMVRLRDLGVSYQHRPMQSILDIRVTDTDILVLLESHAIHETSTTWIVKARETILRHYTLGPCACATLHATADQCPSRKWRLIESIMSPDQAFVPYVNRLRGASVSPTEYHEKRDWEDQCYRPGTSRFPMDGPVALAQKAM